MFSAQVLRSRRSRFLTSFKAGALLALAVGAGCREVDAVQDENAAKKWIAGTWAGSFESSIAEQGSALRATDVEASFTLTDERAGEFLISLPRIESTKARGTFTDFASKGLILKLSDDSNLADLGAPGVAVSIDYQLEDGALELFNKQVRLRLLRAAPTESTQKDPSDSASAHPLLGSWRCVDGQSRTWSVHLKSLDTFSIEVTQAGAAMLWINGSLAWNDESPSKAMMTARSSLDVRNVGTEYRLESAADGKALFRRMPVAGHASAPSAAEEFPCARS